jgi:hypothetical protein
MKKTLMGLAILPFLACTALAGQPLTDKQMDKVTAGHDVQLLELTNSTFVSIGIERPNLLPGTSTPTLTVGDVNLGIASMRVIWGIIP